MNKDRAQATQETKDKLAQYGPHNLPFVDETGREIPLGLPSKISVVVRPGPSIVDGYRTDVFIVNGTNEFLLKSVLGTDSLDRANEFADEFRETYLG